MAWEKCSVEGQRLLFVKECLSKKESITNTCKKHNISRKTGYKWLERYLKEGIHGLQNQSRAPHTCELRYSIQKIERAIDLKMRYRTWGPKKIIAKLEALYPNEDWPSPTRLYEIFKEHHLVTSRRIRHKVPATAPLGHLQNCNDTWAVDLKGWFLTEDGAKCEPLTMTDCVSRYLIKCVHLNRHTADYIWPVFEEAFKEYGLPNRVRSDNGPPFGSIGAGRLTILSVNLIKAGVIPEWIQPGHPEENGRHERFHLTLKQDAASPPKSTLAQQIQSLDVFQQEYNFERPHEALGMRTPGSCYTRSIRSWDGILRSPDYDRGEVDVRKICQSGCLWLNQEEYYIGQALVGEYVGLKRTSEESLEVYYGPVYLGKLTEKRLEKPKILTRSRK